MFYIATLLVLYWAQVDGSHSTVLRPRKKPCNAVPSVVSFRLVFCVGKLPKNFELSPSMEKYQSRPHCCFCAF